MFPRDLKLSSFYLSSNSTECPIQLSQSSKRVPITDSESLKKPCPKQRFTQKIQSCSEPKSSLAISPFYVATSQDDRASLILMVPEDSSAAAETFFPSFHGKKQKNIAQIKATRVFFFFFFWEELVGDIVKHVMVFCFWKRRKQKKWNGNLKSANSEPQLKTEEKQFAFGFHCCCCCCCCCCVSSVGFHWFVTFGSEVFALHCVGKWSNILFSFYFFSFKSGGGALMAELPLLQFESRVSRKVRKIA